MFRPVPMVELSAVLLERDQRTVLQELGRLGAVQLTPRGPGPTTAPLPPRDQAADLARCTQLLSRLAALRRALGTVAAGVSPAVEGGILPPGPASEIANVARMPTLWPPGDTPAATLDRADAALKPLEDQAGVLLKRREHLSRRCSELSALREQVSPYHGLELPLDEPDRSEFLHFVTGALPPENLEQLQREIGGHVALLPLAKTKKRQCVIALTTRRDRPALAQALERAGFQAERLPQIPGATVDTLAAQSQHEQETVAAELDQVDRQLQQLAAQAAPPLAAVERLAAREQRLLEAEQKSPRTETTVLLTGWVPAPEASAVAQRLNEVTSGRCMAETVAPRGAANEPVPVLLCHTRWLRPFERLVAAYGLPQYQELEPTLFVALSFVLMFGMMFGDAGQGLLLALGGTLALAAGRTAKVRDLGVVLLFAGVSSIVFGLVYGSYFGLPQLKHYALWHDPLEGEAMTLLAAAVGFGVVMISLGLLLNIANRFRNGDLLGGCLDKFGLVGLLFYWGMLALLTRFAAFQSRGWTKLMLWLVLVVPLAGWTLKGPIEYLLHRRSHQPVEPGTGLFAAGTESLVGAFEAILSYLANTISFVRLAAYAMSHAALLMATFLMAAEVQRASRAGSVLVIILGNLVALVLEGIIASVQALRLEYYEFFGKFFSGAGRPFEPFRLSE